MAHQLMGDMKHCFCSIVGNNAKCCVCGYEVFDKDWEELGRKKTFAVAVLAEVWAGAKLPKELIDQAKDIESKMKREGTWASA